MRRVDDWRRGLLLVLLLTGPATAADWPGFLGPRRDGISSETGLLKTFPATGPPRVWRFDAGVGMAGLAVSRNRLVTLADIGGKQQVLALQATTGKRLWQTPVAPAYRNGMGNGTRATPTIVGDRVLVFTGEGRLAALSLATGKLLWKQDVVATLGGQVADYGMSSSPLVAGKLVVVTPGAPAATVVAYQLADGKLAWKAGSGPAGYSSPALLNIGGRLQVVAFAGASAWGLDPVKGTRLWQFPYVTDYDCNIATPLAHRGQVFLSSGENHGSVLLALKKNGSGFTPSAVWESFGPTSVMRNEWQTSILWKGHLYGMDNVGGAGPITHLNCVEVATGKRVWQQRRFGKGNLIAADGRLWISTLKGELVLVAATPEGFTELARADVLGPTRQAPALANGKLYLRDNAEILCLDVKAR